MNRVRIAELAREQREAYIRARLAEALRALRHSPMPHNGKPAEIRSLWPDIEREKGDIWWSEGSGLLPGTRTRLPPTRAQISAMEEVLPWLYGIQDIRHRLAVVLRLWPGPKREMGWRRVASELSAIAHKTKRPHLACSYNTAKLWERLGVECIEQALRQPAVHSWRWDCSGTRAEHPSK